MEFRKLEIFSRVAQLKNFSAAARSLHMAQPAVSIAVQKLEQELGLRLLDRTGREVRLTAEGKTLLLQAQAILQQVEELRSTNTALQGLLQGELSIACPSMLATYLLPDILSRFLHDHPGLQASVTQAGTGRIEEMLLADDIEVGVITSSEPEIDPRLDCVPLVNEQMVLCMSLTHAWANRKQVKISELHETPMVVYESGYFIRSTLDRMCEQQGVAPVYRMQTNFLPLLLSLVKQGLGTTVGLRIMAAEEPGLRGVPISPRVRVSMFLAKRRDRPISIANQAFMDWAATQWR
ncbi:MAG: LysR family transcriptional regulator [Pseudomonadota bacterium]